MASIRNILTIVLLLTLIACTVVCTMKYVSSRDANRQIVLQIEQEHRAHVRAWLDMLPVLKTRGFYECATYLQKIGSGKTFIRYEDGHASRGTLTFGEHSPRPNLGDKVVAMRTANGGIVVFVSSDMCK